MTLLVGYASPHGSTREIAERIADRIHHHGLGVEVRALARERLDGTHEAAVLGSAVHSQAWLPEAEEFVRANQGWLANVSVWLFSVGLARALGGMWERQAAEPKGIPRMREVTSPEEHRILAGVVWRSQLPPLGRLVYAAMRGRYGDFRNWDEIDLWADEIARRLTSTDER